jgi:hypothetical protein
VGPLTVVVAVLLVLIVTHVAAWAPTVSSSRIQR